MKRGTVGLGIIVLCLGLSGTVDTLAAARGMVTASGYYFVPRDENFKAIYGNNQFYPELKAAVRFSGKFYLWAAYGFLSRKGETAVLNLEAKVSQHFFSSGIGYSFPLKGKMELQVESGLYYVKYKEKVLDEEVSNSALGLSLGSSLLFPLSPRIFAELSLGFLTASDTLDDISIKLGGFKGGIGLGITF